MTPRLASRALRTPALPLIGRLWIAAALALLASPACAQGQQADPIDTHFEACLASPAVQTTAGMIECTGAATRAWDTRLNETYQQALAALDPASRSLLRTAQRQWLAFRTAERAAQKGPWADDRGSMIRVQLVGANLAAIKARVQELRVYLP